MVYYSYIYSLNQKLDLCFDYFLRKEYLCGFLGTEKEQVVLNSETEEEFMTEGENMELIIGDRDSITAMDVEVLEIQPDRLIDLRFSIREFVGKGSDTLEEDQESLEAVQEFLGTHMYLRLQFRKFGSKIQVHEMAELDIDRPSWFLKIFWKVIGWYMKFRYRHMHRIIKDEIEGL